MKNYGKTINIVASLITLANFLYSIIGTDFREFNVPEFPISFTSMQFILFVILESILASAFGFMFLVLAKLGHGMPFIAMWIVGLLSAWTSIFNVQWMIVGGVPMSVAEWSVFVLCTMVAVMIAAYMIFAHFDDDDDSRTFDFPETASMQGFCFLILTIIYAITILKSA